MNMTGAMGQGIKRLRQQRGWSLDRAAQSTGVSKAMLGQIERGESSPTLNTLWKIARGYEVPFSELMAPMIGAEGSGPSASLEPAGGGLSVRTLVPYDGAMQAELLELTLAPGHLRTSQPHETGVIEHVIVVQGALSVEVDGQWQALTAGEVFKFTADRPHSYRNDSPFENTVFHNLIHYPQGRALAT